VTEVETEENQKQKLDRQNFLVKALENSSKENTFEYPGGFFSLETKNQAIKIINSVWAYNKEDVLRRELREYLNTLFELWKIKHGIPPLTSEEAKKIGTYRLLLGEYDVTDFDEEDRQLRIKNIPPWNLKNIPKASPLGLLEYLLAINFNDVRSKYFVSDLLVCSVIMTDELNDTKHWPDIIKNALFYGSVIVPQKNIHSERGFQALRASERGLKTAKRNRELQHQALKNFIHTEATLLLSKGLNPRKIIGILDRKMKLGNQDQVRAISNRQIRNLLQDHPQSSLFQRKKVK